MKNKKKLIIVCLSFCSSLCFADPFPLNDNTANALNQNIPNPNLMQQTPPITNAVPQIQNNNPVNTGNIVLNNNANNGNMISTSDKLTADLNNYKKQQLLIKEQNSLNSNISSQQNVNGVPSIQQEPEKPISATMISYILINGKTKFATIQYLDGSTLDVQLGSLVAGYKVEKITPDLISLKKYDKSVNGKSNIVVRKSNPIITTGINYGNTLGGQSLNMVQTGNK